MWVNRSGFLVPWSPMSNVKSRNVGEMLNLLPAAESTWLPFSRDGKVSRMPRGQWGCQWLFLHMGVGALSDSLLVPPGSEII